MDQGQDITQSAEAGALRRTFHPTGPRAKPFGQAAPRLPSLAEWALTGNEYDPRRAYVLSVISAWAYSDAQTLANKLTYYGLSSATVTQIPIVNNAMLVVSTVFYVQSGPVGILVFRGTEPNNVINWLTDAEVNLRPFHQGRIHAGFHDNVEAVWTDIDNMISKAVEGKTPGNGQPSGEPLKALYIAGHSLGAAMAVVAAARIFTDDYLLWQPLVRGIYTFGQPFVGDKKFADHYGEKFKGRYYRHVYRFDVVPRLPPRSVDDFVHFGEERFAEGSCSKGFAESSPYRAKQCLFVLATSAIAASDFIARRLRGLRNLQLPYSLDDHSPARYVEVCRAAL